MHILNDASNEHDDNLNISPCKKTSHLSLELSTSSSSWIHVQCATTLCGATHPLLVQFQQLLRDLGRVDGHPQALDVELRDNVLQHLLQRQAAGRSMSGGGWNGILEDGPPQGSQLRGEKKK